MQAHPTSAEQSGANLKQLFAYPFRIFFLSMTVLTLVGIPLWVLEVSGVIQLPLAMPALFWHQHEMLFGFLSAAIAGFLLTAVCVWTQTERTHGLPLALLWGVWLAGRLLLALGGNLPDWMVQGVNLAFLPLVMIDAGWRVWHARQKRQAMIMVVLGLLWLMQIGFVTRLDMSFSYGALIMALALISIIGGRITPAFTAGWLRQRGGNAEAVKMIPGLDMAALFSMILLMACLVTGWKTLAAVIAVVAAALMLVRLYNWKGWLRQRGGNAEAVKMIPGLDMAALFSMILLMASLVTGWKTLAAVIAVVAAALMLVRLYNWKGWLRQRGGNAEAVKMIPGLDMAALFSMILL